MKIPIFVSCPTALNPEQQKSYQIILEELDRFGLEERRLGSSDYPTEFPLREVLVLARHCAGGVFDYGVTDAFVHKMPPADMSAEERIPLSAVFMKW